MICKVKLLAGLMLALALPLAQNALAEEAKASAAEKAAPKADAAKGEALFNNGAPDRNVPACMSCHGAAGNSAAATNPKLAGQQAEYIVKQLQNFKNGKERANPVMGPYASTLSDQEMRDVGAYLAKQAQKPGTAKSPSTITLGQKIYRAGLSEKSVPACAGCHGPNGAGIPAQYPRIGGQWADYTEAQLVAFAGGQRKNSAPMAAIAAKLSGAEMKAVADYIAGIR